MKAEYDFSRGKRGAVLSPRGKTRITIYLDDAILERFKAEAARTGKGYQTLINEALAQNVNGAEPPVTASQVRKILREELKRRAGLKPYSPRRTACSRKQVATGVCTK